MLYYIPNITMLDRIKCPLSSHLKCLATAADGAKIILPAVPILHVRSEACLSIGGGWRRVVGSLAQFSLVPLAVSPLVSSPSLKSIRIIRGSYNQRAGFATFFNACFKV